jgi:hypothetical protein
MVKLFLGAKTTFEILKEEYLMVYKDSLLPFLTIRCIFSLTNKNATLNLFVPQILRSDGDSSLKAKIISQILQ